MGYSLTRTGGEVMEETMLPETIGTTTTVETTATPFTDQSTFSGFFTNVLALHLLVSF